ncbi:MAG: imidazoleglycerol-phosphate dehydratase [Thermodesulfobacteriota bacterium]
MERKAEVTRKTSETDITLCLNLDGQGRGDIKTPIPFFTHMLTNMARHGLLDLSMRVAGDVDVDLHHTVEDTGLVLGEALKKALGDKAGITRCSDSTVPMMDSLSTVVIDICGRPYFRFNADDKAMSVTGAVIARGEDGTVAEAFDMGLAQEFLTAFANASGADLHVTLCYGRDIHHSIESIFKALGRAIKGAVTRDERIKGVPSTKGQL